MKKLLLIFLLLPMLSFGQIAWKKGWNGNVEWGDASYNFRTYRYRPFQSGFIGARIYNDSALKGKLMLRIGGYFHNYSSDFFLKGQEVNYWRAFTLSLHYRILDNRFISPVVGMGYGRVHWEDKFGGSYQYYDFNGLELNAELWLFPKSRFSLGLELSFNVGKTTSYYAYGNGRYRSFSKYTDTAITKPLVITLQYKLFQKEKVFFNKNNE